jgi:transcription elongation factor Elf1
MSGWSDSFTCPNCGSENTISSGDYKPFDAVSGECFDCGFHYFTQTEYYSLEELNERRVEFGDESLTELPKQEEI